MESLVLTFKSLPGRDANQFISEKAAPVADQGWLLASFQKRAPRAVSRSCSLGAADRLAARPFLKAFCLGKRHCTSGSLHPLGLIWTQGRHAQNKLPRPCQADLASACKADYIRAPSSPPPGALRLVRGGTELAPSQIVL